MTGTVCVVGSLNEDTTLDVRALPAPGETTLTTGPRRRAPGGKGANQAAAAAVLGAEVAMVGAVGDDGAGQRGLTALRDAGVVVSGVVRRAGTPTGVAVLVVDATGENTIVVDAGANASLGAEEAAAAVAALAPSVLLLQLEVPLPAVAAAARAATGLVVLNPAPMPADPGGVRDLLRAVDVLVPNRGELGRLAGRPEPRTVAEVADGVAALGHAGGVVVTLGAEGALCFPGPDSAPVAVAGEGAVTVDASGAGDVFCGCLARELAAGATLPDAARRANAVAAASTAYAGARIDPGLGRG